LTSCWVMFCKSNFSISFFRLFFIFKIFKKKKNQKTHQFRGKQTLKKGRWKRNHILSFVCFWSEWKGIYIVSYCLSRQTATVLPISMIKGTWLNKRINNKRKDSNQCYVADSRKNEKSRQATELNLGLTFVTWNIKYCQLSM
jgi:hypothetical protein